MIVFLLVLVLVLFGSGFVNPIWWVIAATVMVYGVLRYGRGGGGGGYSEYWEYRSRRDRQDRRNRRHSRQRRRQQDPGSRKPDLGDR